MLGMLVGGAVGELPREPVDEGVLRADLAQCLEGLNPGMTSASRAAAARQSASSADPGGCTRAKETVWRMRPGVRAAIGAGYPCRVRASNAAFCPAVARERATA